MAGRALNELQAQIEAIRREAFTEGYAAAMQTVKELAAQSAPQQGNNAAVPNGNGRADEQKTQSPPNQTRPPEPNKAPVPLRTSNPVRRSPAKRRAVGRAATGTGQSRAGRAKRGANAGMIQEILQKAAPRAVRQAEIRRSLEERGVSLAYPSIGHALGQLKARKAAKQVGKSGTWRYSAAV